MSKKKLLSENQIRRFQGLAGIPSIGEGMYGKAYGEREEEEEMEEGMHADGEREEEMGDEPMGDLEMDVEMEPSAEGGDLDLSPEQKEDLAADIVRAVAQELSSALDLEEPIEVETDGGEDMEMDMDMDMGDDEEMDLEVGDEPMGDEEEKGMRADMMEEEEGVFAPNHYCVHHGGVHHEGKIHMAEAVGHNWSDKENRVTHYDMKLENGTVLENVAFEDIQVTNASLAQEHKHAAKRHAKDEEELDESNNDDLVSEVLRRVVARLSNK